MSTLTKPHIRSNFAKPNLPQDATLRRNDADPARSSSPNIARRIDFQSIGATWAAGVISVLDEHPPVGHVPTRTHIVRIDIHPGSVVGDVQCFPVRREADSVG